MRTTEGYFLTNVDIEVQGWGQAGMAAIETLYVTCQMTDVTRVLTILCEACVFTSSSKDTGHVGLESTS